MFQNPMPKHSCKKSREIIITQKVLVTQSSDIVHCDWHTQKPIRADFQAFWTIFPCSNFFHFLSGRVQQIAKNFTFCWFWLGKMHWNGFSGMYLGFEVCQIQWCRFWVSMISGSWKIKISGKNFTFCWFWLGKMHWNGLSGTYLGCEACQIQWHRFWVSTLSGSWKIKILGDKKHKMGLKTIKGNGTYAAVLLGSHSTPSPCFRTLCLNIPVKNQEKSS